MLPHGMFIYTKGSKEDPENYRSISQTLVLDKDMEQITLSVVTWHIQDNQESGPASMGL